MNIGGWSFLAVLAIIAITFFYRKAKVWGGLTTGIVIGIIVGLVYLFRGQKFAWDIILKGAIIGSLAGALAECLGIFFKQRKHQ